MKIKAHYIQSTNKWATNKIIQHSFLGFKWETYENRMYYLCLPKTATYEEICAEYTRLRNEDNIYKIIECKETT